MFVPCVVLEVVGAASATLAAPPGASPTAAFTAHLPTAVADFTLLAIALGAVCANALNIYSGAMSFLALGIRLPLGLRRAIVAIVFGALGFLVALLGLDDGGHKYEDLLLVISYWIGPWLAVYLTDWYLRRGWPVSGYLFDRAPSPWTGFVAMALGMPCPSGCSANQLDYKGPVPARWKDFGDITFEVGFVVSALLYALTFRLHRLWTADTTVRR